MLAEAAGLGKITLRACFPTFRKARETWLRMQLAYDLAQVRKDERKIKVRRQHVLRELRAQ